MLKICGEDGKGEMNVYDFDNTLYDGESTFDFYFFCLRKHPKLAKYAFVVLFTFAKYKMCLVSEDKMLSLCETYVNKFLNDCPNAKAYVKEFWTKNAKKLKSFYKDVHKDDDVVISASFGFLIKDALEMLSISNSLCSEVDLDSGKIKRLCFRKNKSELFEKTLGEKSIDDFYTDSYNDMPLMKKARGNVFLVRKDKIRKIDISGKECK